MIDARKIITPEELQAHQYEDEKIIFVLAGLMVDTYAAMLTRNGPATTKILMRTGQLLKSDEGFLPRFKQIQFNIIKELERLQNEKPGIITP